MLPQPQIEVGTWLAGRRRAAAIDVSDGLALDLHRLCRESGAGACIDASALMPAKGFCRLCAKLEMDPLATILGGGEDYALLFCLPPRVRPPDWCAGTRIGRLETVAGVRLLTAEGIEPLAAAGWDHFDPGCDSSNRA